MMIYVGQVKEPVSTSYPTSDSNGMHFFKTRQV